MKKLKLVNLRLSFYQSPTRGYRVNLASGIFYKKKPFCIPVDDSLEILRDSKHDSPYLTENKFVVIKTSDKRSPIRIIAGEDYTDDCLLFTSWEKSSRNKVAVNKSLTTAEILACPGIVTRVSENGLIVVALLKPGERIVLTAFDEKKDGEEPSERKYKIIEYKNGTIETHSFGTNRDKLITYINNSTARN